MLHCNTCTHQIAEKCYHYNRRIDKNYNGCSNHSYLRDKPVPMATKHELSEYISKQQRKEGLEWLQI